MLRMKRKTKFLLKWKNGISAIEDAMNQPTTSQSTTTQSATQPTVPQSTTAQSTTEKEQANKKKKMDIDEVRSGTSEDTIAAPDDFPDAYDYGSGRISDYSRSDMLMKMPEPTGNQTVQNTEADAENIQVLYLWEEGNVPAATEFTESMTGYFDEWDFRPYVTAIPVRKGVQAQGAVVLMAGGSISVPGQLYRRPSDCSGAQRAGISYLYRGLQAASIHTGRRGA